MRKKLIIFPFDSQVSPIVRHKSLLENMDIVGVVSPKGWGYDGQDAGRIGRGTALGLEVTSDFDAALDLCDTVYFTESYKTIDLDIFVYPKIFKAIEKGKNIICSVPIENSVYDEISAACKNTGVDFKYYNSLKYLDKYNFQESLPEKLLIIKTPVIFIAGLGENVHKFEVQLALRENFLDIGYRVSQIGSRNFCELLEFHSFPAFMYSKGLSESDKILLFNRFVKQIESNEKPEIILIGIPGGIMPLSEKFTCKFGITAFEVSQALKPDAAVLCTYYENETSYFNEISKAVRYKFGFPVDCHVLSNIMIDYDKSKRMNKMSISTVDCGFINEKITSYTGLNEPVYNILDKDNMQAMSKYIIDKLSEYPDVVSV